MAPRFFSRWVPTTSAGWLRAVVGIVLLAALGAPAFAQSVRGRLLDDATGAGIEAARVMLVYPDGRVLQRVLTDHDGTFQLRVPAPGRYRLRAQRIGYVMTTSPALQVTRAESLTVEFRLSAQAVSLAPITVVGRAGPAVPADPYLERKGFYQREVIYGTQGMGFGYFLEGDQLRPTAFQLSDLLRQLPGIQVQAAGGSKVRIVGRRGCEPSFFLDGTRIAKRYPGENVFDAWVVPSSVMAIEVYPAGVAPIEYGSPCGAVVVWTGVRRYNGRIGRGRRVPPRHWRRRPEGRGTHGRTPSSHGRVHVHFIAASVPGFYLAVVPSTWLGPRFTVSPPIRGPRWNGPRTGTG